MKISHAHVVHYLPNGSVQFFNNHRKENPTSFSIKPRVKFTDIKRESTLSVGITLVKKTALYPDLPGFYREIIT